MDNGKLLQIHPQLPKWLEKYNLDGNRIDDLVMTFASSPGLFAKVNNGNLVKLHTLTPLATYRGDIDGDGRDNLIANFGPNIGTYSRNSKGQWLKLSSASPTHLEAADLDGNGRDDLVFYLGTKSSYVTGKNAPIIIRYDNGKWSTLLANYATRILAAGDIDKNGKDDIVISSLNAKSLTATSTWVWMNNSKWAELATAEALGILGGTPIPCIGGTVPIQNFFGYCGFLPFPGFSRDTYTFANLN
jgi:hypothetical protein